jgi:hypothetical protein
MRFAQIFKVSSLAIVVLTGTLAGCSTYNWPFPTQHSVVDDAWGSSYQSNVAKMTANPDAGEVGEPIELDPTTGELVSEGYHESQKSSSAEDLSSIIKIESGR